MTEEYYIQLYAVIEEISATVQAYLFGTNVLIAVMALCFSAIVASAIIAAVKK